MAARTATAAPISPTAKRTVAAMAGTAETPATTQAMPARSPAMPAMTAAKTQATTASRRQRLPMRATSSRRA
jgi:hypothetical protein